MIVPGRYGHIFPHGGSLLAASVDGHPNVAGVLRRLPCCRIHQDGDFGELTVVFDVADFAKVARIIRPRRRRQVSPEQRERLRGMGFPKGAQARVDVEPTARPCVPEVQADLGAVAGQTAPFSSQEAP
jgi:Fe2+ transport system protein FeoA